MRNYKTTFEDEEENTQHFMEKLAKFKNASKDIKKKNTLAQHKHEWQKEYQIQKEKELKITQELIQITQQYDIQFKENLDENLYNYQIQLQQQTDEFQKNLIIQLQNIKQVMPKLTQEGVKQFKPLYDQLKAQFTPQPVPTVTNSFEQNNKEEFDPVIGEAELLDEQDTDIINQYEYALDLIEQTYDLQVQKIEQDYTVKINENFQDKEKFEKFRHIYNTYIKKGKDREFYYERLKMIFKCNRKDFEEQDLFFQNQQLAKSKKNAVQQDCLRSKLQIKQKTEQEIHMIVQKRIEETKNEQEKLQLQMKLFKKEYEIRKQIFLEKKLNQTVIDKKEQQRLQQLEEEKKCKDQKYHQQQKQISTAFKDQKSIKKQQEILEVKVIYNHQIKKDREEQEKKREIEMNSQKVNQRQNYENFKMIEKMNQKEYKIHHQIYEQQRINSAIENYTIRPKVIDQNQVEKDFNRLKKETLSLKNKKATTLDKGDNLTLNNNKGFTVDKLFSDIRYRLGAALYDAGLNNNTYGHQILQQFNQRPQ